jgi:hypothetical protein
VDEIGRAARLRPFILILGVGILAVAVIAFALTELLTVVRPSAVVESLTDAGLSAGLISVGFALWGTQQRSRLIYEFYQSAVDMAGVVRKQDLQWRVDERGQWVVFGPQSLPVSASPGAAGDAEELSRYEILYRIGEYEDGLIRLGALAEAREIDSQLQALRSPSPPSSKALPGDVK